MSINNEAIKFRTKTIIELTQEYIMPILDLANIEVDLKCGYIKPKGIPNAVAFSSKGGKNEEKFMIVAINEDCYNYHMYNPKTTTLINPFILNSKGNLDTYKLMKFIERIIYCMEIGDYYVDDEEVETLDKDEDTIRAEMEKYIEVRKAESTEVSDLKRFTAEVFNLETEKWKPIAVVDTTVSDQFGLLLLASEVCKYYTQNFEHDEQVYGNMQIKALNLVERSERLQKDLDKNFEVLKLYTKEFEEKQKIMSDKDLVLDTSNPVGIGNNYIDDLEYGEENYNSLNSKYNQDINLSI